MGRTFLFAIFRRVERQTGMFVPPILRQTAVLLCPGGHVIINEMKLRSIESRMLRKASALSALQTMRTIAPEDVVRLLNKHKISFVLVGAYGLAVWIKKPRATEDVDFIVSAGHHKKAVRALLGEFPHLEADEQDAATRLRDKNSKDVAIDVMRSNQQLLRVIFKNATAIELKGERCRIPTLEMALALKFAAMISLHRRDAEKYQDAHDFIRMVEANPEINGEKLAALGELAYSGGGAEIAETIRQVRAGEKLKL